MKNHRDTAHPQGHGPAARIRPMSVSGAQRPHAIAVGSRVTVIPNSRSRSGETEPQVGVVVKDYADTVIDNSELGRNWAPVLRWAIALDNGRLAFTAEGGLELA